MPSVRGRPKVPKDQATPEPPYVCQNIAKLASFETQLARVLIDVDHLSTSVTTIKDQLAALRLEEVILDKTLNNLNSTILIARTGVVNLQTTIDTVKKDSVTLEKCNHECELKMKRFLDAEHQLSVLKDSLDTLALTIKDPLTAYSTGKSFARAMRWILLALVFISSVVTAGRYLIKWVEETWLIPQQYDMVVPVSKEPSQPDLNQ